MGLSLSAGIPPPEDFTVPDGFDRSSIHDRPWIESLRKLASTHFTLDEQRLEAFLQIASDEELYCCRVVHRAYARRNVLLMSPDENEFSTGVYFTTIQQPSYLLLFMYIIHLCAKLDMVPCRDFPELLGRSLVIDVFRTYTEERQSDELMAEEALRKSEVAERLYCSVNDTVRIYLEGVLAMVKEEDDDDIGASGGNAAVVKEDKQIDGENSEPTVAQPSGSDSEEDRAVNAALDHQEEAELRALQAELGTDE